MARYILSVVAAVGLLAATCFCAWAQEPPPAPALIGVVDLDLVGAKFERKLQEEERLTQWYREQQRLVEELSAFLFVSPEEWEEILDIHGQPKAEWTEEQQTRLQTLKDLSKKWERELKTLEAKQRTPEEDNRFNLIRDILRARQSDLQKVAMQIESELAQKRQQLGDALMEPVQAAINQIAAERGLTVVIEKRWVYFGGDDITEQVTQRVNAAAAAAAGGGQPPQAPEGDQPPGGAAGGRPTEGGANE